MASNGSLRLVVIDSDPAISAYVKQWVNGKGVRIVGEAEDCAGGLRLTRTLQPDLILLELPFQATPTMEFVRRVRTEFPGTGIIVTAQEASPQLVLSCIRAGAHEFVPRPIDGSELEKAINHIRQLSGVTLSGKKRGRVISVVSSKGGIGATSFTANVGLALAQRTESKIVLVDMSLPFGDLGVMLDAPSRFSLTDALVEGVIEEAKLRSVLVASVPGVHLLSMAASPEDAEGITRQHMIELVGVLSSMFDYVVIDVGRQLDDRTVEVLELSDSIMLLTSLDLPTVRNTVCFAGILTRLKIDREKIHVVLNRYQKKSRLSLDDVEAMVDRKVFWSIPNDYEPMSMGIDRGVPAVQHAPRSKVAKSYLDLADRIHAESAHSDRVATVA